MSDQTALNVAEPVVNVADEIKIDLDELTFGDLEMAAAWQNGQRFDQMALLEFLNRVVIGGVKHIKVKRLPEIMDAFTKAVAEQNENPNSI